MERGIALEVFRIRGDAMVEQDSGSGGVAFSCCEMECCVGGVIGFVCGRSVLEDQLDHVFIAEFGGGEQGRVAVILYDCDEAGPFGEHCFYDSRSAIAGDFNCSHQRWCTQQAHAKGV